MLNFVLLPKVSRGHGIRLTVCGFCPELTDTGHLNSVRKAPIPLCWGCPRLQSASVKMAIVRGGLRALVEKPAGKISCCFSKCVTASWQALTWKLVEILEITYFYSWNKRGNWCSMKLLRGWTRKLRFAVSRPLAFPFLPSFCAWVFHCWTLGSSCQRIS